MSLSTGEILYFCNSTSLSVKQEITALSELLLGLNMYINRLVLYLAHRDYLVAMVTTMRTLKPAYDTLWTLPWGRCFITPNPIRTTCPQDSGGHANTLLPIYCLTPLWPTASLTLSFPVYPQEKLNSYFISISQVKKELSLHCSPK